MPIEVIKSSFAAGELAPAFWGRVDNPMWHRGASVMRNMFVNYRGPASSRAGLGFVGQCKQVASASSLPPRIITFRFNIFQNYVLEFGDFYMRVISNGAYVTEAPFAVTNITQANPAVVSAPGHDFVNGDWVAIGNVLGMTRVDGRTFIVAGSAPNAFSLRDTFGDPVDSRAFAAYAGGGTVARILTVASPYAAADLPWLKFKQSANLMSLTCINQQTGAEYPPTDLTRISGNNWAFSTTSFASSIAPPATCTVAASVVDATNPTSYSFVVTAIDAVTGEESQPSPVATVNNSTDIATTAGSLTVTWSPVPGAAYYQIYQAPPAFKTTVPVGSAFGFIGRAFGTQFVNTNIVPDFAKTPPAHVNPFARGQIQGVGVVPGNANFNQASTTATVNTATGVGASIIPVVVPATVGAVQIGIVQNSGHDYRAGDTVTFTDSVSGASVIAPLMIGPQTGTYPGVVAYFQQRRYYAMTINEPDTQFLSQTGAYTDFDTSIPPVDDDAIISTPWAEQINAVQWAISMPGGLLVATGLGAWQVSGTGGAGSVMTPAAQAAIAQESYGFSPTVPPIKVNYAILYVPSLTASVREQQYNFWNNIYASVELSVYSNHLFENRNVISWAWAPEPNKLIWSVTDDGKFLSMTYPFAAPEEQIKAGFARHDTNGIVAWNEVATEPPVHAPYFIVKRFISGKNQWAYYVERMDNRLWESAEDTLCMDAALALPNPTPNATLSAAAAQGPGIPTGGFLASGGNGYTAPSANLVDPAGTGSGCVVTLTFTPNGPITDFALAGGQNYSPGSQIVISDPTGFGAAIVPFISQNVVFLASAPVFGSTLVGDVIRIGGGQATVSQVTSPTQVLAAITIPIQQTIPNDPNNLPLPAAPGKWSITTPVAAVQNLDHLEGMQVCVLADGAVVAGGDEPLLTVTGGSINLPQAASSVKVGLPFTAQLQAMHTDIQGAPTVQGKKQSITGAVLRMEKSRGVKVGGNQPVASTLSYRSELPWQNMHPVPDRASVNVPAAGLPLFTGDSTRIVIGSGPYNWNGAEPAPGMVAVQQSNPLPMNILAIMSDVDVAEPNA